MEVFRISRDKYAGTLTGSGKSARWNKDNQHVLYTAQARSLSALEFVVHRNSIDTALNYQVMVISIADDEKLYKRMFLKDMPSGWRDIGAYSALQDIGADWYVNQESLILQVPSALIPQEFNFIINLRHPDFSKHAVSLIRNESFDWDNRLM